MSAYYRDLDDPEALLATEREPITGRPLPKSRSKRDQPARPDPAATAPARRTGRWLVGAGVVIAVLALAGTVLALAGGGGGAGTAAAPTTMTTGAPAAGGIVSSAPPTTVRALPTTAAVVRRPTTTTATTAAVFDFPLGVEYVGGAFTECSAVCDTLMVVRLSCVSTGCSLADPDGTRTPGTGRWTYTARTGNDLCADLREWDITGIGTFVEPQLGYTVPTRVVGTLAETTTCDGVVEFRRVYAFDAVPRLAGAVDPDSAGEGEAPAPTGVAGGGSTGAARGGDISGGPVA